MTLYCRSVFGGTVGPNPAKPVNTNESQYYEGIKIRAVPLVISVQSVTSNAVTNPTPIKPAPPVRRKGQSITITSGPTSATSQVPTITLISDNTDTPPPSPASPILKAQLSAPSKTRESSVITATVGKSDAKSQVLTLFFICLFIVLLFNMRGGRSNFVIVFMTRMVLIVCNVKGNGPSTPESGSAWQQQ